MGSRTRVLKGFVKEIGCNVIHLGAAPEPEGREEYPNSLLNGARPSLGFGRGSTCGRPSGLPLPTDLGVTLEPTGNPDWSEDKSGLLSNTPAQSQNESNQKCFRVKRNANVPNFRNHRCRTW